MGNSVKYNSSATEPFSLKKGNFYIGTGDVQKGPSNFWNTITPPVGGYTVYLNKPTNGPSIYSLANDTQLISVTNQIAGTNYTTIAQCLTYYAGQSDKMVFNRDYEEIITNGLVFGVDAGFIPSYPRVDNTWYDLIGSNNGTFTNGPTFSLSNGGSVVFDGTDDHVNCGNSSSCRPVVFTQSSWIYNTDTSSRQQGIFCSYSEPAVAGFFVQLINSPHVVRFVIGTNTGGGYGLYTDQIGNITINTNTWYQITVSYDGSSMKSYVNGVLDINFAWPSGIGYDAINNLVGVGSTYTEPSGFVSAFKGNISNCLLYNRALTQAEIIRNYDAQKTRFGLM